jgi:4-amino-4-deoxy-L-arabinose transferase-like glycosyltransferase
MNTSGRDSTVRASSTVAPIPLLILAVIAFVVLFWRLGAPSFWDPDEAHYAETTRELVETGDRMAPYYNEQPFFDKPILFHWLQGIPMALLGPTEFAARLTPALAALALIGVTAWVGVVLLSVDAAIVAALLLATSPIRSLRCSCSAAPPWCRSRHCADGRGSNGTVTSRSRLRC